MALNQEKKPEKGESIKKFINYHFASRFILITFIIVCFIRVIAVFVGPLVTSDLLRDIFYGQQFWKHGFGVYDLLPQELDPSFSIIDPLCGDPANPECLSWPNNMYDYPALNLLFFAAMALTFSPVVISKLVFVIFDIINFFFLNSKEDYRLLAWVYFLVSIPFSSVEGQVESVTVFLFLLGISLYEKNHRWAAYFIAGLGFQWKIIPVILFPYFFLKDALVEKESDLEMQALVKNLTVRTAWFALPLVAISIPPLLVSKYLSNSQFFRGFQYDVGSWNPLYLFNFTSSAIMLVISTLFVVVFWFNMLEYDWKEGLDYVLLLELCFFFSILYKYAMPWAWLYFIPALIVIPSGREKRLREIVVMFVITFILASMDFFNMTVGIEGLQHLVETIIGGA
ncbi:MAG: hypothetical protein ACFFD4_29915 [Candidatus Odinarchaeota archaeon]